jgi:hypothetical protein
MRVKTSLYRVVCPDGHATNGDFFHHKVDALTEAEHRNWSHGDCVGPHTVEVAYWHRVEVEAAVR